MAPLLTSAVASRSRSRRSDILVAHLGRRGSAHWNTYPGIAIAAASVSETTNIPGELLQREPDLQSDLIALNLAVLDRTAHLRDFEPAEIS